MAIGFGVPVPKGKTRKQLKARKDRTESRIIQQVRAQCVERDGDCRFSKVLGTVADCWGESEWAHLEDKKRFKTRGLPPEDRHTTARSMMLCTGHHQKYDRYRIGIEFLTTQGADGRIAIRWREGTFILREVES